MRNKQIDKKENNIMAGQPQKGVNFKASKEKRPTITSSFTHQKISYQTSQDD